MLRAVTFRYAIRHNIAEAVVYYARLEVVIYKSQFTLHRGVCRRNYCHVVYVYDAIQPLVSIPARSPMDRAFRFFRRWSPYIRGV